LITVLAEMKPRGKCARVGRNWLPSRLATETNCPVMWTHAKQPFAL